MRSVLLSLFLCLITKCAYASSPITPYFEVKSFCWDMLDFIDDRLLELQQKSPYEFQYNNHYWYFKGRQEGYRSVLHHLMIIEDQQN